MSDAKTRIEWFLEIEWDRKSNTGTYSRHKTREEAKARLDAILKKDPPARWRIHRYTTIIDSLEQSGTWEDEP